MFEGLRMRSYYAHLETAAGPKPIGLTPRPVFRSSAIFPVLQRPGISSRILFMGYWILKRHIQQISAIVTLRSEEGTVLNRTILTITEAKAYRIELSEQLEICNLSTEASFTGSMEVEFFSNVNLVFPYPAVVINYYGPNFCSVVHTAQRVYNDFEDMRNNSQTRVPESGFNIYADENREPFIGLINGPLAVPNSTVSMQFFNLEGDSISHEVHLGDIKPYQTEILYPAQLVDIKSFLKGKVGAGKLQFQVNWIFPRLVVGNIQHSPPAMTITHTYYDCTAAQTDSDYWLPSQPKWYPASLMIPLNIQNGAFTNIYFYPIYPPSSFAIDIEIYDNSGKLIGSKKEALRIKSPINELKGIEIKKLCDELKIPPQKNAAARINARTIGDARFPARVKLAVDIGNQSQSHMPCNICTNLHPFNPALDTKPSTFRWFPILADQPNASVWVMNSSPEVNFQKTATLKLTFFRDSDTETLNREVVLQPHGFLLIRLNEDEELKKFFGGKIGWCTVVSTNPYATSYYLADNPSGVVGGDHGF